MTAVARLAAGAAAVLMLGTTAAGAAAPAAQDAGTGWRDALERAAEASRTHGYTGRLAVISLGPGGPDLAELEVSTDAAGRLQVSDAEAWMVGRSDEGAFYLDRTAGRLLELGVVDGGGFSLDRLAENYEVGVAGRQQLDTGDASVVVIRDQDGVLRERLFVDEATGVIVRRETYGTDGEPVRLVAFTRLTIGSAALREPGQATTESRGPQRVLEPAELRGLEKVGWIAPQELPGGFELLTGTAVPENDGSLHLRYTDGLYGVSVYEQMGAIDASALEGARATEIAGMHVWRWPGAEPERMVWSGEGRTFTAVSDAPTEIVAAAISVLPSDDPPSGWSRLGRGLQRVGSWLWPFD